MRLKRQSEFERVQRSNVKQQKKLLWKFLVWEFPLFWGVSETDSAYSTDGIAYQIKSRFVEYDIDGRASKPIVYSRRAGKRLKKIVVYNNFHEIRFISA